MFVMTNLSTVTLQTQGFHYHPPPSHGPAADAAAARHFSPAEQAVAVANAAAEGVLARPAQRLAWRCNLASIAQHMDAVSEFPFLGRAADLPTLLVYGTRAGYVRPAMLPAVAHVFPRLEVLPLPTGHWVHAERPAEFVAALVRFMDGRPLP
jgi:esterase